MHACCPHTHTHTQASAILQCLVEVSREFHRTSAAAVVAAAAVTSIVAQLKLNKTLQNNNMLYKHNIL